MASVTGEQQFPESKFFNRLLEISFINSIWITLSSRYFLLKGKFWVLDEILRITENTVFWVEQKTEHAVSSYKLDNYLKKIDTAASDIVSKVEYTVPDVVKKVQNTASDVVTKVQDTASNVKNVVEDSRQKLIKSGKGL